MKNNILFFAILILISCKSATSAESKDKVIVVKTENKEIKDSKFPFVSLPDHKKKGYKVDLKNISHTNSNFRRVLYSNKHMQLVVMSLKPNEEIGEETHLNNDQLFSFEKGRGKCTINGNVYFVESGDAIIIPAGAKHNIRNISKKRELKMFTVYAPPQHKDGIIRVTKAIAHQNESKFDGITSE